MREKKRYKNKMKFIYHASLILALLTAALETSFAAERRETDVTTLKVTNKEPEQLEERLQFLDL